MNNSQGYITTFTALGIAIAVQISWGLNHSILWATFHGLIGWAYVIYRGFFVGVY